MTSMVEDDSSERAKEQAKKNFEELSIMDNAEAMIKKNARAITLALIVKYHGIEVTEQDEKGMCAALAGRSAVL